eukprot:6178179-Pleurochrysis_carterae.AAC.1
MARNRSKGQAEVMRGEETRQSRTAPCDAKMARVAGRRPLLQACGCLGQCRVVHASGWPLCCATAGPTLQATRLNCCGSVQVVNGAGKERAWALH